MKTASGSRARMLALALVLTVVCCAMSTSQERVEKAQMPPFTGPFAAMAADYYRLAWTDDGYPGKLQDDGTIWEHPLYPVLVLNNYLAQQKDRPSPELREAIEQVADRAVSRMDEFHDALVFWYEPGNGARLIERHYSALTQGYYAERLWLAAEATGEDRFKKAAEQAFLALTIPHEDGGVLFEDDHGVSIAEVPQEPNSYILNGWQSALIGIWNYAELSGDERARQLFERSARTMAKLLPRYDAPEEANSRYGLTGFAYVRTTRADLQDAKVTVPGEGTFDLTDRKSRWVNHRVDERRVNLVFSRASKRPNRITLDVDAPTPVEVYLGTFDPLTSAPAEPQWVGIGEVTPEDGELEVPSAILDRIVYPTNFVKVIAGHRTNVYHPMHVNRLRQLGGITGEPVFAEWERRWADAMCEWGSMPVYDGLYAKVGPVPVPVGELC